MTNLLGLVCALSMTLGVAAPMNFVEPRVEVQPCESSIVGTPHIYSVELREHTILLNGKVLMPYTLTFSSSTTYTKEGGVTVGAELTIQQIFAIGGEFSLSTSRSVTVTAEHSIYYDEPGYRYVKPVLFSEITTVEVPVYKKIRNGACEVVPTYTYIEYPSDFVFDGYYYTSY